MKRLRREKLELKPHLILATFLFAVPGAIAKGNELVATAPPKFELSAIAGEQFQLSEPGPEPQPLLTLPPDVRLRAGVQSPGLAPSRQAPQQPLSNQPPQGYAAEYNVNWAPWMEELAKRWQGNLRYAQSIYGVSFEVPRPALIQFTCYADGQIGNLALKQSSGVPIYDRMQIAALMGCSPMPRFPVGTIRPSITLTQGWESHVKRPGEEEFEPGRFAQNFPKEKVNRWVPAH